MERQLRELWEPFTGGDQKSFFDMVPEIFAGMKTMLFISQISSINITLTSYSIQSGINKFLLWNQAPEPTKLWTAGTSWRDTL